MTSKVSVSAHCGDENEVVVTITDNGNTEEIKLQDGEAGDYYVYDDREVYVKEVAK